MENIVADENMLFEGRCDVPRLGSDANMLVMSCGCMFIISLEVINQSNQNWNNTGI